MIEEDTGCQLPAPIGIHRHVHMHLRTCTNTCQHTGSVHSAQIAISMGVSGIGFAVLKHTADHSFTRQNIGHSKEPNYPQAKMFTCLWVAMLAEPGCHGISCCYPLPFLHWFLSIPSPGMAVLTSHMLEWAMGSSAIQAQVLTCVD